MKIRTASCPSCGGPVQFGIGTAVTVCEFCHSAVARGDKDVEDYGKVADLVETSSRLRRGLTGTFNRKHFTIVGHVQYRHPAGGAWDEWYLAFPGGKWGWLAEAQGKTYLLFERQLSSTIQLPPFDDLEVGRTVRLGSNEFDVKERGVAESIAAEGEIPWPFRSGAEHRFADLTDTKGTFATFEYGEQPRAFVGKEISLDDLDLQGQGWHLEEETIATEALVLNCPKCGGQLPLRVPDQTLRVTCQHCNSLLDADKGKLSFLASNSAPGYCAALIPLGTEGELFKNRYTVIGFMRRYATWEGKMFPWDEYLLYSPSVGFRWLVHNDRHWSFVEPAPSIVSPKSFTRSTLHLSGDNYRIYDRGTAYVRYVTGEFYWKVQVGEKVRTADFIAPPRMLSFERSYGGESEEINISLGRYVTVDEIEKAFSVKKLPRPWSVGVIQPRPQFGAGIFGLWALFILLLMATHLAFSKPGVAGSDGWLCFYGIVFVSLVPIGILISWYAFEVKRWENSDYSPYATE